LRPIKEAILIPISVTENVLFLGHKRKTGKKAFLFFSFYVINIDCKKRHMFVEVIMKFYHVAPEAQVEKIYGSGIQANEKGEIPIIALKDDFLLKKFIFDLYAHEVLRLDVYCLFEITQEGVEGSLFEADINNIFSDSFKISKQPHIERKYLKPFKTDESYEGMGLIEGVFPVENKDKFTDKYKRKVLEYLKEIAE
jgi:hypothetical protein